MATSTGYCVAVDVAAVFPAVSTPVVATEYSWIPAVASYPAATRYEFVLSIPSAATLTGAAYGVPARVVSAVVVPVANPVIFPVPTLAVYTNFEAESTTVLRGVLPLGYV